jgi:hypothetical protein
MCNEIKDLDEDENEKKDKEKDLEKEKDKDKDKDKDCIRVKQNRTWIPQSYDHGDIKYTIDDKPGYRSE